jgi:hypothetical protein
MNAVQTALELGGRYTLPIDPARIAHESCFEIRHQLRGIELDDEQIAAAEAAVALVLEGTYPTQPADATAAQPRKEAMA